MCFTHFNWNTCKSKLYFNYTILEIWLLFWKERSHGAHLISLFWPTHAHSISPPLQTSILLSEKIIPTSSLLRACYFRNVPQPDSLSLSAVLRHHWRTNTGIFFLFPYIQTRAAPFREQVEEGNLYKSEIVSRRVCVSRFMSVRGDAVTWLCAPVRQSGSSSNNTHTQACCQCASSLLW